MSDVFQQVLKMRQVFGGKCLHQLKTADQKRHVSTATKFGSIDMMNESFSGCFVQLFAVTSVVRVKFQNTSLQAICTIFQHYRIFYDCTPNRQFEEPIFGESTDWKQKIFSIGSISQNLCDLYAESNMKKCTLALTYLTTFIPKLDSA